jgi:periplasmic copper chaperone A
MPKPLHHTKLPTITALAAITLLNIPSALADLVISDAWVRAMPPTQTMTAGYATLSNEGTNAITITGASSDIAPMATLHSTVQAGDSVRMIALPALELAPGERFSFVPGGAHIMLMQMPSMPSEGAVAQLCFNLSGGEARCTEATVRRDAPAAHGMDMNNNDMHHGHHGD